MRTPNQNHVIVRLEGEVLRATDKVRKAGSVQLNKLWAQTRVHLQNAISSEYRHDFPKGSWTLAMALRKGTIGRINSTLHAIIAEFHMVSQRHMQTTFREMYRTSALRNAWMLDNLTPPKMDVKLPQSHLFFESIREAKVYKGPEADTAWKERWASWNDAYLTSLQNNIKLGAINESVMSDAVDEVDATRTGSPASFLQDAMTRIYTYQSLSISSQAQKDVVDANEDYGVEQIWQTRYNARVCDICDANKGLTMEEADDTIPAHPNCECYWRLVPATWAELLRSGDTVDRELARRMDAKGLVPGSMLIPDENGNPVAAVIVSFENWLGGQPVSVSGGVQ